MFELIGTRSFGEDPASMSSRAWDALAEKLLQSALVDSPDDGVIADLKRILKRFPRDTQHRWIEMLRARVVSPRAQSRCSTCSTGGRLNLSLGLDENVFCKNCAGQFNPPADLLVAPELDEQQRGQMRGIPKGSRCLDALTESFEGLCSVSDSVVVLDRYAVVDALRTECKEAGTSGFVRFAKLADVCGVSRLRIVVGSGSKLNGAVLRRDDILRRARELLTGEVDSIEVYVEVLSEKSARQHLHDRWIGFQWGGWGRVSWTLGKGLAQFSGDKTSADHGMARQDDGIVANSYSRISRFVEVSERVA